MAKAVKARTKWAPLGEAKPGDLVRLMGDDSMDDRGDDVIAVLEVSPSRVKVQRVAFYKKAPVAFRAVEVSPEAKARVLGKTTARPEVVKAIATAKARDAAGKKKGKAA